MARARAVGPALAVLATIVSCRTGPPPARPTAGSTVTVAPGDPVVVELRILQFSGGREDYRLHASGVAEHSTSWESATYPGVLSHGAVDSLGRALFREGLCALASGSYRPNRTTKQRMVVTVRLDKDSCSADLPWEDWSSDSSARTCADAIRRALRPLSGVCGDCTFR